MTARRRIAAALLATLTTLALAGCEFTGLNSVPLPGTKGGDGYRVTVEMENAVNLVPNSEVKIGEVTVGSVRRIEFDRWRAKLTLGIEDDVRVPENVVAKIAQKSLLGAEYLELSVPSDASSTLLADGDTIGLDRSGRFPETEEVLSSLSLLLNGGGLGQVKTITSELNQALDGREADVRSLVTELDTFVGTLDAQKQEIVAAIEGIDRLAGVYADESPTVDKALRAIPRGVDALAKERAALTRTLDAIGDLGEVTDRVVTTSQDDLVATVENVAPILRELSDAGSDLTYSLGSISFPFPLDAVERAFRGDYINFFATIDVSLATLERDFLAGTPLEGVYSGLLGLVPGGAAVGDGDPLIDPLGDLTGKPPGTSGPELGDLPLLGDLLGGPSRPRPSAPAPTATPTTPATSAPPGDAGMLGNLLRSLMGGA